LLTFDEDVRDGVEISGGAKKIKTVPGRTRTGNQTRRWLIPMSSTQSWARGWICATDLPDVSNVFGVARSILAGDCRATVHGVVVDILVWERDPAPVSRLSFPVMVFPDDGSSRRLGADVGIVDLPRNRVAPTLTMQELLAAKARTLNERLTFLHNS